MSILNWNEIASNEGFIIFCLILATVRIYIEVIGFDLMSLPLTKKMAVRSGAEQIKKFHKSGLYLSVGYIIFFAPGILFY